MTLHSYCFDLHDASGSIGTKHKSDDPGNEVVIYLALSRIGKLFAVSTRWVIMLNAAGSNLTPRGLLIAMTPGTATFQIRPACPTVKAAICH